MPSIWAKENELQDPDNFNLMLNKQGIDPFNQFSQLPRMAYLNDPLNPDAKKEEEGEDEHMHGDDDDQEALLN